MSRKLAVWFLLSLIWGSTWLFIKVGLQDLPPFTFAALRFAVGILALLPLALLRRHTVPRDARAWTLMVGTGLLTFTVAYGLVFWGQQFISSGLAALLFATFPLSGLIVAHFHLASERMTWGKVVGVLLGIAGVGLVFSNELRGTGTSAFLGSVGIVVAAFSAAYADVLIKWKGGHLDPIVLTLVQMAAGMLPLAAIGAATEGNPLRFPWTPVAAAALVYLGVVGTALAFVLLYWLIRHMDVTKTMLITLVTPLIAVLLGIAVLGETLTWHTAAGGLAILAALGLTVWQGRTELRGRAAAFSPERLRAAILRRDAGPDGGISGRT